MSEHAIVLVDLSISEDEAPSRAAAVARWLLDQGVIEPNPESDPVSDPDPLGCPSAYRPGPRAAEVAPDIHQAAKPANNGVDFVSLRQVHDPGGNYEPPSCRDCEMFLDTGLHIGLIQPWIDGPEPDVTCPVCGESALLGDWSGEFAIHVANLAVRFNNWPRLTEKFANELGSLLGPRTRVIYQHY